MLALQYPHPAAQRQQLTLWFWYKEIGLDDLLANGNQAVRHLKPQPKSECFLPHLWHSPHEKKKKSTKSLPKAAQKGSRFAWNKAEVCLPQRRCSLITRAKTKTHVNGSSQNRCSTWAFTRMSRIFEYLYRWLSSQLIKKGKTEKRKKEGIEDSNKLALTHWSQKIPKPWTRRKEPVCSPQSQFFSQACAVADFGASAFL